MQENWKILLKQAIKSRYVDDNVHDSREWVDVNISTSGLLNTLRK